jgi:hypothetical protein
VGEKRNAYRVLVGELKERYHLEDLGVRERYNIKMYVEGIEWDGVDGIDLAQDSDG